LLLFTGAYMPATVVQMLTGGSIPFIDLDLNYLINVPILGYPAEFLDFEQKIEHLEDIGLESGSSFTNNYSFMLSFLPLILLHLFIKFFLPNCKPRDDETLRQKCCRVSREKLIQLFEFAFYIRMVMESYQFMLF
jgi:hypothetical protein